MAGAVVVVLLMLACASEALSQAARFGAALSSQRETYRCMRARYLVAVSFPRAKLVPYLQQTPGLTGVIQIQPSPIVPYGTPGVPHPGPRFDGGSLVFFSTHVAALRSQRRLAEAFVFHKLSSPLVNVLAPVPPTAAAARSVQRVAGNAIVFWRYPRKYPTLSDALLNVCLRR